MKEISYSEARQNLANILSIACLDNIPVYITRKNGERAVVISADEYESMDETAYLMRTEANKKHLQESISQANAQEVFSLDDLIK